MVRFLAEYAEKAKYAIVPRPQYISIIDEIGMKKSMPAAPDQFEWYVNPDLGQAPLVFIGLGPEPEKIPEWFDLPSTGTFYYVENPAFIDQAGDDWEQRVPANFTRLTPDQFSGDIARLSHVARYLPAQRAFPSFFAPLTARLILPADLPSCKSKTVWLPHTEDDLLGKELAFAFRKKGFTVSFIDHEALGKHPGAALPELLAKGVPDLFFSVNFKGFDHFGLGFHILREAGVDVAVWLVDNPFNVLPGVKSVFWKDAKLFVTDHTFIGPLTETGAKWVKHLPLAASPKHFSEAGKLPPHGHDLEDKLVFVGRSEFPAREKFFARATVPASLREEVSETTGATRFDYHWWRAQQPEVPLWPGNDVRNIGAGAELAGRNWKFTCLESASPVTVFGDDGWKEIENADVRPQVDYYAHLPAIYRAAAATLNVTGMQLPAGLTQRHFDVWCSGGFLLTDANPGLAIFPDELVREISFDTPDEIPALFERFRNDSPEKNKLRDAWQELILREHTYENRIATVLESLGL
ncbi:glycosyltransferase [uncultured Pseudodesulfovibrio sp.]|uniref:glycosyltransferase family protein n=2 Tax=uncultured Pseudodesulfovibrio sp. TaxID=2035858 RepID=UPI0029C8D0FC|nr:DUF3880 domain-containing protein [uncultured Pseudodesulfovibrio sp.]